MQADVYAPPPEATSKQKRAVNATAADLEALELEPAARQAPTGVPIAALFGTAPNAAEPGTSTQVRAQHTRFSWPYAAS